jgi:circadian clock protein KaiC
MSMSSSVANISKVHKIKAQSRRSAAGPTLPKAPSGIDGLDSITAGGLPRGRPTLVCGGPGCGKTLFAMEFLVRGASQYGEPGVFIAFEETANELAANVASLGFDLQKLAARKQIAIDYVRVERGEIEETGEYDLEGLFVRLDQAIKSVRAKRVVLDSIESLFAALPNPAILRTELRRLFAWLKARGMTVVLTGERGDGTLTRDGLEEYVTDCVILLDHRVNEQVSTRRLRVVKYRGSTHGTNEYPFLIDEGGISVLPITSLGLDHQASTQRVSSGIPRLDQMLGGRGYFKGSTVLVSGTAGTGKTTIAGHLAAHACASKTRCLYLAFEESPAQIQRNLSSVGIDLGTHVRSGRLRILPARPQSVGLEMHLALIHEAVLEFRPALVIMDPISNLLGSGLEARSMLTRLIDFLKNQGITALFTNLTRGGGNLEETDSAISSLIDTWLMLEIVREGGERNRILNIIKSRGMAHSNQTCEFRLSERGIEILDTYLGPTGALTGSARLSREAEDRAGAVLRTYDLAQKRALRQSRRRTYASRVAALREEFAADDAALARSLKEAELLSIRVASDRSAMAESRGAFARGGRDGKAPGRAGE